MDGRHTHSILARVVIGAAVVVLVIAGIWVTGGLVTNDFGLAMALTAIWLGVAALACLAIAWRRPGLRVPVLGAFLVTALVAGVYLGRSQLIDDEVNEQVARASATGNELVARGQFEPVAHSVNGTATTIRTSGGRHLLTLTNFEVDNGPDLRVYLVAGPARDESEVDDFEDLGALKGNKGNQQYELPRGIDLDRYTTVVVWCRAFSVNFARAPLT
jgi:hypothetical protein